MTVLITGATGLIGRAVTGRFLHIGAEVRVLTRRPHRAREMFGEAVGIVEWHPMTELPPDRAFQDVDLVVHLMGEPVRGRWSQTKRERVRASRVVTTEKIADAIAGKPVRLLSASSFAIYPGQLGESYDERAPLGEPASFVKSMIHDWELAAFRAHEQGASVAILRFGMVASPGGYPNWMVEAFAAGRGVLPGDGAQIVPVVDIEDVSLMVLWAAGHPEIQGPVNCVAPSNLPMSTVVEKVSAAAGRGPRLKVSPRLARFLLGPNAEYFVPSYDIKPHVAIQAGYEFLHPDANEILGRALQGSGAAAAGPADGTASET